MERENLIPINKIQRIARIQRSLHADAHPCDESRKTPEERMAIERLQGLRNSSVQDQMATAFFVVLEPRLRTSKPTGQGIDTQACCGHLLGTGALLRGMDLRVESQVPHHK